MSLPRCQRAFLGVNTGRQASLSRPLQHRVLFTHALSKAGNHLPLLEPTIATAPHAKLRTQGQLLAMTAAMQSRAHSGHSHGHSHDNSYLTSTNRRDAGVRVTRLGLYVNVAMAISKGLGGYYFNSQALIADGVHALTDMASDFVTLASVSYALRPPTKRYPNGYGRAESLGSVAVSGLLLGGGVFLGLHALGPLYTQFFPDLVHHFPALTHLLSDHGHGLLGHSHTHELPDLPAAWIAAGSIVVKEWLYRRSKPCIILAHYRMQWLTELDE